MELQELQQYFTVSRHNGADSYQCICPVHQDKKASLTISKKNGNLLLHCHAGCATQDILEAVGLTFQDLGDYRPSKLQEKLEFAYGKPIEAIYDYKDEAGRYLYSKVRFQGKEIRYFILDRKNDRYECGRKGRPTSLYNLPALLKTIKAGFPVCIVEGEKDVETLRKLGYTATTAGGVNDWKAEYARYFTGAQVIVLPDNDEPGFALKDEIHRSLKHFAHSVRWAITVTGNKGDMVSKPEFEAAYWAWCMNNDVNGVAQRNIKERMEKNGCPEGKANINGKRGVMVYRNLKRKPIEFDDVTEEKDEQQEIPFRKAEDTS